MTEDTRLTTHINGKWLTKMAIFFVLLAGLGVWATFDAFWAYPARGRHHVDFALRDYLECLNKEGRLLGSASVEDPAATLNALDAANAMETSSCDAFKYVWLVSLSRVQNLSALASHNKAALASPPADTDTIFANPQGKLDDLNQRLGTQNAPKPLAAYDIPLQYLFMLIGFGGAAWLALFLAKCRGVSYAYDPAEHRLFLPGGRSFIPAEIKEVDKRDWHKYYVYLTLSDGSKEMKLDLLRYAPLEEWILDMEKLHPNYEPPPPEPEEPVAETSEEKPEEG